MIIGLTSRVEDRVFETRSGQRKDYKIGMCCFSDKHTALKVKCKGFEYLILLLYSIKIHK